MLEEVISIVVQILIDNEKPVSIDLLVEESDFDEAKIGRAINVLKSLDLVIKSLNKNNITVYSLIKELKAIHLARAAQIGIDLSCFEGHFIINQKEKKLALELATQAEKIKVLDINKRKPLVQKRSYFSLKKDDDISENLMILLEASSATLHDYLENLAKKDANLKLLLTMHDQAERAFQDYTHNLQ